MCGISGIVARDPEREIPVEWIEAMMAVQAHRGPDDGHHVAFPGARLGFNRLSIQDPSPAGRQPMAAPGRASTLVFNGEVYNFVELAEGLGARGVTLRSRSDTEVLLHRFLLDGERCLEDLNGMFGFAIFDPDEGRLFAARDRFGIKPFYYFANDELFCFGSEIKALLALPFVPREPDLEQLYGAVFEHAADSSERTSFAGIRQLRPAHRLVLRRDAWQVRTERYWALPETEPRPLDDADLGGAAERLRELLTSSVALRLRSDRPVGLLLSGGMDSSAIAAMIAHSRAAPAGGFAGGYSMALEGDALDESSYARSVAEHTGLGLRRVQVGALDLESLIPRTLWHNDEPLSSLNRCAHLHILDQLSTKDVIVVLNGQGGDELMGGYFDRLVGSTLLASLSRRGPAGFRDEWRGARELCGFSPRWLVAQLAKTLLGHRLTRLFRAVTREQALCLGQPDFVLAGLRRPGAGRARLVRSDRINDQLLRWLLQDTVPELCHYEDRNAAALGMEQRFPFLDYRLVEFAFTLPGRFKTRHGVSKRLLREAMRAHLPAEVNERHAKLGLAVPEDEWVRGPIAELVRDTVASRAFRERGIWRAAQMERLVDRHLAGETRAGNLIWRVVSTELWWRMFLDAPLPAAPGRQGRRSLVSVDADDG
ncbi:MAG: asparagine synthase (glutamine-hydrolyzing) [Myxococcota bacterium]|nr:asparagine synthase (glutamine-hydrolyzing) [Myxococcota bacterium]